MADDLNRFAPLECDPRTGELLTAQVRERLQESAVFVSSLIRNVEAYRRRLAARMGVSVTELRALGRIAEATSATPSVLAAELGLTTGSVTSLLDRLEQLGFVQRVPNPSDRRSIQLELTAQGADHVGAAYRIFQERLLAAVQATPDTTVAAVVEFLRLASDGYEPVEDPGPEVLEDVEDLTENRATADA